ncbi:MoaD/ThiS family protein [Euzebya sp.]|uniref:MoaD/ThiS family protein n=1 Tax=Euzebya sp. TaxID=1971409 RepID=UPI003512C18D
MARGAVLLPSVLTPAIGGVRRVDVDGATIREALTDLCRQHPALMVHLFDSAGRWRRHVLCVHHDEPVGEAAMDAAFAEDDELVIMPAVSGG